MARIISVGYETRQGVTYRVVTYADGRTVARPVAGWSTPATPRRQP